MTTLGRTFAAAAITCCVACSSDAGGGDGGGDDDGGGDPRPPAGWRIDVDLSGLDRFVPAGTAAWPIAGTATATEGLDGVELAGAPASVDGGAFAADVAVAPGVTVVPIVARDRAGNARQAHRTLLSADFLPEGTPNSAAATLVLTDAILASMGAGLADQAADVDVAAEIMARDVLSQDDRCVTWPAYAEQGEVRADLVRDGADLWLRIRVPNLYIYFQGACQGLISQIPIAGEMGGTVDLWTRLTPRPPEDGGCLTSFDHTRPEVYVSGWYFDVWGTSGPLQNWIVQLFSGSKSAEARAQIQAEVGARGDAMLAERLAEIHVFDQASTVELFDRPVAMRLCLADLVASGTSLIARVGASATGQGARVAPGAPMLDGAAPAVGPGELVLDAGLVAQLLFSAWRDGGLARPDVQQVELELIGLLVPELRERYPGVTHVDVAIDGELPPVVRAGDPDGADLHVTIGDLMLDLRIGDDRLFRFGVLLELDLDLVPDGGVLVPTLVDTDATAILLDELVDAPDAALEDAVELQIGDAAAGLLAGAGLALPALPGLGAPADVTADAGGRFLRIRLE